VKPVEWLSGKPDQPVGLYAFIILFLLRAGGAEIAEKN